MCREHRPPLQWDLVDADSLKELHHTTLVTYPSQTSLAPNHHLRSDERLGGNRALNQLGVQL